MRNCEECQACCQGYVQGSTRGSWFGNLKPCKYLVNECTIYEDRPSQCRNYFCAWTQELLPIEMRPDKIGVVVSVEVDGQGKQYLKAIHKNPLDQDFLDEINRFVKEHNTYFTSVRVIPIGKQ